MLPEMACIIGALDLLVILGHFVELVGHVGILHNRRRRRLCHTDDRSGVRAAAAPLIYDCKGMTFEQGTKEESSCTPAFGCVRFSSADTPDQ